MRSTWELISYRVTISFFGFGGYVWWTNVLFGTTSSETTPEAVDLFFSNAKVDSGSTSNFAL